MGTDFSLVALAPSARALVAILLVLAGLVTPARAEAAPERLPESQMVNQTSRHEFDLAFKMSLKLAEQKSGIENALVLLPSLPPGRTIEQAAAQLFSELRVGARTGGRGLLFLYAERENLMRIEVSYNLEGSIPDAYCRRLEEAAKTYMLSEVPQDFISELIITTNLKGIGDRSRSGDMAPPQWLGPGFLSGGGGATATGYRRTLADYQSAVAGLPPLSLERFAPAATAEGTVERYLDSLDAGIGDPRVPLITEGSRIFRAVVPRNAAQQRRIHDAFRSAGAYRIILKGDLGLVVPGPDRSNLPIVMRHGRDGLWYVDEPKSWTYFHRFEDDGNFHVKFSDNPFLDELRQLPSSGRMRVIYGARAGAPPPHPYPFRLQDELLARERRTRESPGDARACAALGDLYLFEMNWLSRALEWYERAVSIRPEELRYRWRLVDLYMNASRADKMLDELRIIAENRPADREARRWYEFYREAYRFR